MVLPGVQALFGFQLIAVFSAGFTEQLSKGEQRVHVAAIGCVVLAIALVMAPAALHRQAEPHTVSLEFIDLSSRLLMWSMPALAAGVCLDVYLVSRIALGSRPAALCLAGALLLAIVLLWFVMPRWRRNRRAVR